MSIEPHVLRTKAQDRREKLGKETHLSKSLDEAADEIERLRAALRPFVEAREWYRKDGADDEPLDSRGSLKASDLDRAVNAYQQKGPCNIADPEPCPDCNC